MGLELEKPPHGLTPEQARLVAMVAAGWTDARIARTLRVSESTVRRRISEARRAIGASSRIGLAVRAALLGYVRLPRAQARRTPDPQCPAHVRG